MNSDVQIRELRNGDTEALIQMVRAAGNFSEAEVLIANELLTICESGNRQDDYHTFIAEAGETPLGFLILGPTPATDSTYDMYWIVVEPIAQGKGIGTQLDEFAVRWVIGRGGKLLIAETSSKEAYDPTRAFYERRGYKCIAEVDDYYGTGDSLIWYGKRF